MTSSISAAIAKPVVRAQTLPMQGLVNRLIRAVLRAPLLGRLAGKRLVTLYVVGRKSGRRYAVPVAYTRRGDSLLVGSQLRPDGLCRGLERDSGRAGCRYEVAWRRASLRDGSERSPSASHYLLLDHDC
jgi:hypothetical protein